jgi:uncharacterized membrane protein
MMAKLRAALSHFLHLTALIVGLGCVIVMIVTLAVVLQAGSCLVTTPLGEALPELVLLLCVTPILAVLIAQELRRVLAR